MGGRRLPIACLALTALLTGCSVLHPPLPGGPTPPPGAVVVPPDQMTLNVSNGSTLAVTLVVNDTVVAVVPPNDGLSDIEAATAAGTAVVRRGPVAHRTCAGAR